MMAVVCGSGRDGCDVEQAGQSVPCSGVDHHPGCASRVAVTLPAHISAIQGNKLISYIGVVSDTTGRLFDRYVFSITITK